MKQLTLFLGGFSLCACVFMLTASKTTVLNSPDSGYRFDQEVTAPKLPTNLDLAGERVPLELNEVRERVDRELLSNVFQHSSTIWILKFSGRYFPIIEPILAQYGVPDDFKYLAVIESGLRCVTSPAGARGYWQFMKATSAMYGLEVNDEVDERNDIYKSTEAACKYLLASYTRQGSWTAAAAAYNMGDGGFDNNSKAQFSENYYDLYLNAETSRYVPRILALKEIMKHPETYGFHIEEDDLYKRLDNTDDVYYEQVNTAIPSWVNFAKERGVSYATFRYYNPWIMSGSLTNKAKKTYRVLIPKNQKPLGF